MIVYAPIGHEMTKEQQEVVDDHEGIAEALIIIDGKVHAVLGINALAIIKNPVDPRMN